MKKILSALLALATVCSMLFAVGAATVSAEPINLLDSIKDIQGTSPSDGANFADGEYSFDESGALTVTAKSGTYKVTFALDPAVAMAVKGTTLCVEADAKAPWKFAFNFTTAWVNSDNETFNWGVDKLESPTEGTGAIDRLPAGTYKKELALDGFAQLTGEEQFASVTFAVDATDGGNSVTFKNLSLGGFVDGSSGESEAPTEATPTTTAAPATAQTAPSSAKTGEDTTALAVVLAVALAAGVTVAVAARARKASK